MKIIHVCNSDIKGGAARACRTINKALRKTGVNSGIIVQSKFGTDDWVTDAGSGISYLSTLYRKAMDYYSIKYLTVEERGRFTFPYWGTDLSNRLAALNPDIINLHWINEGFLSIGSLHKIFEMNKPVVWTFHDMWAFTGGCHYSGGCRKFESECRSCPSLKFGSEKDSSRTIFSRKKELFERNKFTITTCSRWLAREVEKSALLKDFHVEVIPNPIDPQLFNPSDKNDARKILNFPPGKNVILFGTMTLKEKRKGFQQLKSALTYLSESDPELKENAIVAVFGTHDKDTFADIPFPVISSGRIAEDKNLALLYSSADLFVAPSLEDNLPNTVMEALSCCTPVVAFDIGGMPDMIDHKENGYLARPADPHDLAKGIGWILKNKESSLMMGLNARKKVISNFTFEKIGGMYTDLYKRLLYKNRPN